MMINISSNAIQRHLSQTGNCPNCAAIKNWLLKTVSGIRICVLSLTQDQSAGVQQRTASAI